MKASLPASHVQHPKRVPDGHSLLEMMTVVLLILIVASISVPAYQSARIRTREAVLRDSLFTMRSMIERFTLDNHRPPESLDELVTARYLGRVPIDPFTGSNETWQVGNEQEALAPGQLMTGIVDVHPPVGGLRPRFRPPFGRVPGRIFEELRQPLLSVPSWAVQKKNYA